MDHEQPFRTGDRLLDRFRIGSVFTGGMGVLCAVTDEHTGRAYAVKTVKPDQRSDRAVVDRFREEARTWIDLDHNEHLVQALWLQEDPAGPFLFLEYVDGPDLARLLGERPLDLSRAVGPPGK